MPNLINTMIISFVILLIFPGPLPSEHAPDIIAIKNARIIDGNGRSPINNVIIIIKGTRIQFVGEKKQFDIPDRATVIDANGKTVMPGLADMHIHFMGGWDGNRTELLGFKKYLNSYIYCGVTTILDMGNITPYILQLKRVVNSGKLLGPRIYCVGPLIDSPDAQWPSFSACISSKRQIPYLVSSLHQAGVDFLKAYKGLSYKHIDYLVDEGKKYGLGVLVDQGSLNGSYELSSLNITAFAHLPYRFPLDIRTIHMMKRKRIKCMTTLSVVENYSKRRLKNTEFLKYPLIKNTVSRQQLDELKAFAQKKLSAAEQRRAEKFTHFLLTAQKNLKNLYQRGITIIAGTDAPYPGVFQGEGIHRELELIVEAGVSPLQAITMATKNAAILVDALSEWGTLEAGKLANLLIIDGKPDQKIEEIRKITGVIFKGKIIDRNSLIVQKHSQENYDIGEETESN